LNATRCAMFTSAKSKTLREMSADEVVKVCEINYIDYWRSATAASAEEYSEDGGIKRCITGLAQDIFNVVLCCELAEDTAPAQIDRALAEFRSRRVPMIWHVGKTSTPASISELLNERGFPHDYDLVAMAADLSHSPPSVPLREGVSLRKCESAIDIGHWIDSLTDSWGSPADVGRWMRGNPFFGPDSHPLGRSASDRIMYLGFLNGVPSGAVMLLTSRGTAGLQCVGTVASAQRRGVGEALVRAALSDAARMGHKFVVVLSTTEGVPLYRRAGFKAYGTLPEHSMYFDKMP